MSGIIVCSDKTGRARGTLEPIIYFEREDGYVILPAYDAGHPEQAKRVFDLRYRNHATERWMWRETDGTLSAVDALQKRLIDQERRRTETMMENHTMVREASRRAVRDSLYQRMVSSSTSTFEREAIRYYLDAREAPERDKFGNAITQHQWYLWAREMDANTKIEDKMPMQPGEFWRTPEQQRD
jgi:hypothetical protein